MICVCEHFVFRPDFQRQLRGKDASSVRYARVRLTNGYSLAKELFHSGYCLS